MCDDGSSCPSPKYGPSLPSFCELQLVEPNIVMADAVSVFDLMAKGGDSSIECFLYMTGTTAAVIVVRILYN